MGLTRQPEMAPPAAAGPPPDIATLLGTTVGTSPKLSICVVASTRSCAGLTPGKYFRIPNPSTTAPMLMRNVCKL